MSCRETHRLKVHLLFLGHIFLVRAVFLALYKCLDGTLLRCWRKISDSRVVCLER